MWSLASNPSPNSICGELIRACPLLDCQACPVVPPRCPDPHKAQPLCEDAGGTFNVTSCKCEQPGDPVVVEEEEAPQWYCSMKNLNVSGSQLYRLAHCTAPCVDGIPLKTRCCNPKDVNRKTNHACPFKKSLKGSKCPSAKPKCVNPGCPDKQTKSSCRAMCAASGMRFDTLVKKVSTT